MKAVDASVPKAYLFLAWLCLHEAYSTVALILYSGSASPAQPLCLTVSSQLTRVSTMVSKPQQSKGREGLLSTLDVLIAALGVAGSTCPIHPAQIAISSANALLAMIRVRSSLSLNDLPTHVYPGFCRQQRGLCQSWGVLR